MKKFLCLMLAIVVLFPSGVLGQKISDTSKTGNASKKVETKETEEIRNQNIWVPTKNGVQRATYEEALKIESLKAKPLTELTKSYLLGDYKSGKILESYNIDEVRAMASTSKLVAVFVVLDELERGSISKDDIVLIDREAALLGGSSYKLKENDQRTVQELLEASLIVSGNDAITALAKHIAGSQEAFVEMMNDKCKELGLKNASMVNPTGLTNYEIEDYNKMTTREMFLLARELIMKHPEVLEITSKDKIEEPDRNFVEYNTNPSLGIVEGIDGLKTGYTNAAGRCLISTGLQKGEEKKSLDTRLIGITTGSPSDWARYVAANKLMEEGFKKYKYIYIGDPENAITSIKIENAAQDKIDLYEKSQGSILWDGKSEIKREFIFKEDLKPPIDVGETLGSVKYTMNGEEILKLDLINKDRVTQKGILFKIKDMYENIFINIREAA
ncbi:D-alanyl-D-alanine carboxypeptidase family protein [Peptoniphilus catoniae]|uniref:D-alanyl-D-alanine carboxypeptidase family protein n=1 Tax=Peptoniphilus catoniae TaxID=1660341 RepID=UPI0010FF2FB9|nr:D-alanyl-D-alanine carboxypeptidase family protein [Peptoniphilus catoniae]